MKESREIKVLKRLPLSDYVPVTDENGRRFYLNLDDPDPDTEVTRIGYDATALLSQSFQSLKQQIVQKKFSVLDKSSQNASPDDQSWRFQEQRECKSDIVEKRSQLWVDKYSPRRYTELLSDEATNRIVLKWLKQWDSIVFNKERQKNKIQKVHTDQKSDGKSLNYKKKFQELTEETDEHGRPLYKAVLLCGPPGLGKTTLAHIVSHHAGYNVVEINASDDRSVDIFKQKIESATQMRSVIGADPRPNCLIIDEIDGAPVPAINFLISLLKQTDSSGSENKRKRKPQLLQRPVICICNDLYVPALRQLRQTALIVNIPPIINNHLAARLLEICKQESLYSELTTLLDLCEKTENDVRSCLNTLQFVKGQGKDLLRHMVGSLSLGQKDAHKSLFSVWKQIFTIPKMKRQAYVNPHDRLNSTEERVIQVAQKHVSLQERIDEILKVCSSLGEADKVMLGLFENYLDAKFKDPSFQMVVKATEWLQFVDLINKEISSTQNYIFMKYPVYLPVFFHLSFASNAQKKLVFPYQQNEANAKLGKCQHLVTTLFDDCHVTVRKSCNLRVIVLEILPSLLEVLQPSMRPVNIQLYSAKEKEELSHVVEVMIAYNLCYRQERSADGQYIYVLDPNVEEISKFAELKPKKQLSYAVKQLISREVSLEKMRRIEKSENSHLSVVEKSSVSNDTSDAKNGAHKRELKEVLQNTVTKRQKVTCEEEKDYVDFFGRKVKRHSALSTAAKEQNEKEKIGGEVWFRFKEGFSNAVRRTVRVSDFL